MEKVARTKRVYMKPESKIYPVPVEHLLDAASGNAGVIAYEDDDWDDDETPSQPISLFNQE